ncbi:3-isopropylmalate dehydratase large subunit [Sphingopyxis terrae]|uniref:3-isopropylmalate dehydratase large subunit n=1 Tax=Sphingopyxis terrae subsp. ummariensis TaxID=429001 RepID=A0A1Y6EWX4_9SPHN|nr:3-isopropylmalate dehydratase large subunit [Sphingopyxis terrae]PCF92337.1 3-isopropylmalate dehydratase large subunit [Sphingopyxis terrae subsp. ummariensis]SMQ64773.1 3-isopropylmalate dehydratase, large subunit [Sphingopyxis terrae subsp. ummariensis]
MTGPRTLYDKIWDAHAVAEDDGETLLYVDLHLLHEVTSPQAFSALEEAGRGVRRPERALALSDHNVPTEGQAAGPAGVADIEARAQLEALVSNTARHGIENFAMGDPRGGIVHVVGPEQGRSQPGMTIVCGDSHTSTHGAFGALAFGIGTSEVEHVLATQTIRQRRSRNMRITVDGVLRPHVQAKDLALHLLAAIGVDGATGHVIEYAGSAIGALSMEARMTLCNLSIEMGARAGLIAPDDTTFAYLADRPAVPKGDAWTAALARWRALPTDAGAAFDRELRIDAGAVAPMVSWGTNPSQVIAIDGVVPDPACLADPDARAVAERALAYMGLTPGRPIAGTPVDRVFIGSCTNSRIEDLRVVAAVVEGRRVADHVRAMVVPGSGLVKRQAEAEGIDRILRAAGFDWREPGCSMCVGMNADRLLPGERCAATSNRNFENRQGRGGRTHLMSPALAAASAIAGCIADPAILTDEGSG